MTAWVQVLEGIAVALLLLGGVSGCSKTGKPNQAQEASTLKPIAMYYGTFVNRHQGKPPQNEEEFKAYLRDPQNASQLKAEFQITDIDKLLISPRDNQPYVIYYGSIPATSGPGGAPVIAYEKQGVNGKRFVASALMAVQEVDEAEFRTMVPGAR